MEKSASYNSPAPATATQDHAGTTEPAPIQQTNPPTASADAAVAPPAYTPPTNNNHNVDAIRPAPVLSASELMVKTLPTEAQQQNAQNLVTPINQLADVSPQWIDCPYCNQRAQVGRQNHGTPMQFITGGLLCLLCICLAPVPCCMGWFEETHYTCAHCNKLVAKRSDDGVLQVFGPPPLVPSQHHPTSNQVALQHQQPPQQAQPTANLVPSQHAPAAQANGVEK